jgi:DNA (cytosine-5)-methyltransferase 3A
MSAGQIALKEVGLEVNKYFASEIENHAIKITQHNFPNTIQLGDVRFIKYKDGVLFTQNGEFEVGVIDLLIGGSPCQNLSFIGNKKGMSTKEGLEITSLKQYLDLKEEGFEFQGQSYLFWEYVRLKEEVKPKKFLLENVKMSKKWKDIFSKIMELEPIFINSSQVTFATRPRYYWTNIVSEDFEIEDRNKYLKDNIDLTQPFREVIPTFYKNWGDKNRIDKGVNWIENEKLNCITTKLCHTNQYLFNKDFSKMRMLTIDEARRAQTIPDWYDYSVISKTDFEKCVGNGWTVDVISHIFKNIK